MLTLPYCRWLLCLVVALAYRSSAHAVTPAWTNLAAIPDPEGFAGSIAGVVSGKLLVAGGANFPVKRPWEGGAKRWYDHIFILDEPGDRWRVAGRLPRQLGYSVCVTTPGGIAVLGGSTQSGHVAECFLVQLDRGKPSFVALPVLPLAVSNACGALLDGRLYVAGGTTTPDAVTALDGFLSLDMTRPDRGWQTEPTWPGLPRMLAMATAQDGAFYLVGGVALSADKDGRARRTYLRDGYQFVPESGWTKIADLPWPLAASPTPAPAYGDGQFLLLGGDDGSQVDAPPRQHAGFRREVLRYDARDDQWTQVGELPTALVTTTAVIWNDRIMVPGGEARPGVRSTSVLSGNVR